MKTFFVFVLTVYVLSPILYFYFNLLGLIASLILFPTAIGLTYYFTEIKGIKK